MQCVSRAAPACSSTSRHSAVCFTCCFLMRAHARTGDHHRNVTPNAFVDWFCGGLQYQVDHHLFPSIPRHNLRKVHALVAAFCKQNSVQYHEASMLQGTAEVLGHLKRVSREFIAEFPAM